MLACSKLGVSACLLQRWSQLHKAHAMQDKSWKMGGALHVETDWQVRLQRHSYFVTPVTGNAGIIET